MADNREFLFRVFFRLRVHEAHGDAFQNLFGRVMEYLELGFESILPWGDWGDGGNDGWIQAKGHYFQVYGPRPTTKDSETAALKKAIDDFDKLPKKWQNVKNYTFVYNDRFSGTPAPIANALDQLRVDKKLDHAGAHTMKQMLADFMTLSEDKRQDLLGGDVPKGDIELVDTQALNDVLTNLISISASKPYLLDEIAPDFERKIVLNGISEKVGTRLRSSSYQVSTVDDFLETIEPATRQALGQQMRKLYADSKIAIPDGDDAADDRYFWLMEQLAPHKKHIPITLAAFRGAAELVLAKYFETCDAFEHPDSTFTSQAYSL